MNNRITETTGEFIFRTLLLIFLMIVLGLGGTWLTLQCGIGYTIGVGTAIIVSELINLQNLMLSIKEDNNEDI